MTVSQYVPDRGDVIWLSLNPQAGHEQAGRRPALVLSPAAYNRRSLALVCPMTNQVKGHPFEVAIPPGLKATGVALADQVKSLDWRARNADLIDRVPEETVNDVVALILPLIDPNNVFGDEDV